MKFTIWHGVSLLLLIVVVVLGIERCNKPKQVLGDLANVEAVKNEPPKHYTDDSGRDHAVKEVAQADRSIIEAAYKDEIAGYKSQIKDLKNANQILSAGAIGTHTSGTITPDVETVYLHDSANYKFHYADKWFSINGTVGPSIKTITYSYIDSLRYAFYWKRKIPIIGRKYTYMNAYSMNDSTHITGLTGIMLQDLGYDKFNLDLSTGVKTDFVTQKLFLGLGATYRFTRRFSFDGAYQYEYDGSKFKSAINLKLKFTLIRF